MSAARFEAHASPSVEQLGADVDLKELRAYRLARVREQLARKDYCGALLYDPVNIRYAIDSRNMSVWTMHNAVRYAFVPVEGPVTLFEFHGGNHLSEHLETIGEIRPSTSWFYFVSGSRIDEHVQLWAREIADMVTRHGGGNRRLAVDRCDPGGVNALANEGVTVHEGFEVMELARLIKSPEEIDAMRTSVAACENAMRSMQAALRPGMTENQLWSILHQENIAQGGEWIETRLLASGPRTNPWFQESSNRVMEDGDVLSFDTDLVGPFGYCADISRTWLVGDGKPTDEQRRLYQFAVDMIEYNTTLLKPGVSFLELSEKAMKLPEAYIPNRYSVVMHGVGLCDEYPAVYFPEDLAATGYDGIVEENMTMCVEAYIGADGGREGIKLEQQVLITADGTEPLSTYPLEPDFL